MDALAQLKASLAERYDIEREIGAGGMATVYLARDLRHDRHVALKLLNPELGAVLGVERFLAEIKVTANLQHPNLLPLFDSGEAEGLLFYVMPFVEGESLRARLAREKQLPIDEALRIAVAIANALDYAHSHGVIHRDLKPENILLQAGQPVIADFGIALAVSKAGGNRITQTGLSLGTPQYMSPEQATGDRVIDGRSDIYSLGAVTYEMLTGEAPHTGSTAQAIIARLLTDKPRPMRSTRPAIPEHVEAAVQHALEKLPADRFSTAHEFSEALLGRGAVGTAGLFTAAQSGAKRGARMPWRARLRDPVTLTFAGIAVAMLALALAFAWRSTTAPSARVVRFAIAPPDSSRPTDNYPWPAAISPDGSTVVYSAAGSAGLMFYALRTDQLEARPIPGTTGAYQPLFSPDGQSIAFGVGDKLRKVRLDGSAPITIAAAAAANGADWTTQDEIVIGSAGKRRGLSRVSASGGDLTEFAKPDASKGETDYLWPISLPDGKAVVFTIWTGSLTSARLATASVDGGDVIRLELKGIRPLAVIDRTLVYLQADGSVMAVRLDRSRRHLAGKPAPVLDPVAVDAGSNGNSSIFVSRGGALLTARGGTRSQLSWISRDGSPTPITREVRGYSNPRLSPDGRRIAVVTGEQDKTDVWIYDMDTGTFSRLSSVEAVASPSWTPDGKRVVYAGLGGKERFAIWSQLADGGSPAEKLFDTSPLTVGATVSPDGRSVLYTTYNNNSWDIFRVQLDSGQKSAPYLTSSYNEIAPRFSPDGRWVAVVSDESGTDEVYVRSFPDPAARVQISAGGGHEPTWSADGTRIFYRFGNVIMSAKLATTPSLRVLSRDTAVTKAGSMLTGSPVSSYDVAKDGRFLGLISNRDDYQLIVVPNWLPELEQRLAGSTSR
jgi:eukaryotic-like serine/threonine-protein kinase